MKKETKQPEEKKVNTTVSVAAIETKISFRASDHGMILIAFDSEKGASGIKLGTATEIGMPAKAIFHNTDEIRRCLDYFDEVRTENKKKINTVIDYQEEDND